MKMNCTDINQNIDAFLDQELSALQAQAFEQHVSRCSECGDKVEAEKQLRSMLLNIPVPAPSADFKKRVFARVREEYPRQPRHHYAMPFATGFASAAVFGLALWLMSGLQEPTPGTEQAQVITMAMNQSQSVRLVFDADTDIQEAELSVELPENITLVGYPGRNRLSWHTGLQKGQNVLELPVLVTNEGRGELRTQLSYHNKVKTYHFVVDAKGASNSPNTKKF
jgi:anti-sigma factor (TIGR02949 family)